MLLYFNAKLTALRLTAHEFFHIAHVAMFKRDAQLEDDYAQFLLHGVLPKYVVNYLKEIQQSELHEMQKGSTPDANGSLRTTTVRDGSSSTRPMLD